MFLENIAVKHLPQIFQKERWNGPLLGGRAVRDDCRNLQIDIAVFNEEAQCIVRQSNSTPCRNILLKALIFT